MALRGNLNRLPARASQAANNDWQISRRLAKIVVGYDHARRRKRASKLIRSHVLRGFNFHVAPTAAGAYRLGQNLNLFFPAASKLATSLLAPTSCDQYGSNSLAPQPTQEGRPLFRVTKIVKAQFKLPSRAEAESRLNPHFTRRSSRDYAADAIFPKYAFQATPCTQGLPGCGKSPFGCHSERSEESLCALNQGKERFLGRRGGLGMTTLLFFRTLLNL